MLPRDATIRFCKLEGVFSKSPLNLTQISLLGNPLEYPPAISLLGNPLEYPPARDYAQGTAEILQYLQETPAPNDVEELHAEADVEAETQLNTAVGSNTVPKSRVTGNEFLKV